MFADLFQFELALRCRRRQLHYYRWAYAAWVLVLFLYHFAPRYGTSGNLSLSFFGFMMWQRFLLVLAVTPAFVAGQITEEKERGILQFVFLTPLEAAQILPAKLFAQGYLLTTILLLDVPLLLLSWGLEDFSLAALAAHTVCMVVLIFALGAASLLAAIYCRTTRAVMVLSYLACGAVFWGSAALEGGLVNAAAVAIPTTWSDLAGKADALLRPLLSVVHPAYVAEAGAGQTPATWSMRLLTFALFWGVVALAMTIVGVCKLRPVCLAQLDDAGRPPRARWGAPGHPPVGDNPLEWKAQHVDGLVPFGRFSRVPRWAGVVLFLAVVGMAAYWDRTNGPVLPVSHLEGVVGTGLLALLMFVRVAAVLPGEHQRDTFDALVLTGRFVSDCTNDLFGGILLAFRPYLIAFAVLLVLAAIPDGPTELQWAVGWASFAWLAVYATALNGLSATSGRKGLLHNLSVSLVVGGPVLLFFGMMHFALVGISIALTPSQANGYREPPTLIIYLTALVVGQMVPIATWGFSRQIRRRVLGVHVRSQRVPTWELPDSQHR